MNTKYLVCLFALVASVLSCKKKETPQTIVSLNYQIFDSCDLYSSRTPTIPWSGYSRGKRYSYNKNEVVSFDTIKGFTCTIRGEKFTHNSINDSLFIIHDSKQFITWYDGFPETELTFRGDSLFIISVATAKYSANGYELRAIRK
ncbi:MAG: hypothetical protein V4561_03570 [Bacteroidota bacterium]